MAETVQSIEVLKNALEEKKQTASKELREDHEQLLDRLTKITGAKRVK